MSDIQIAYFGPEENTRVVRRGEKDIVERLMKDAAGVESWRPIEVVYFAENGTPRIADSCHSAEVAFMLHSAMFDLQKVMMTDTEDLALQKQVLALKQAVVNKMNASMGWCLAFISTAMGGVFIGNVFMVAFGIACCGVSVYQIYRAIWISSEVEKIEADIKQYLGENK